MNEDKIEKAPNVPAFVRFVASTIPMVFDDSMSYYEALANLVHYIQDTVDVVNNNATVTEEYIQLTKDLKEYMDHYFDNLNVQNEINTKLDSMAEDGQLSEVFSEYFADYVNPQIEAQNRRISDVEDRVNSAVSGQPKVVSSTSQMSDHNQIYVNTTDNKWYYWNGSAWAIGGSYPASSIGNGSVSLGSLTNQLAEDIYQSETDITKLGNIRYSTNVASANFTTPIIIKAGTTITFSEDFVSKYKYQFKRLNATGSTVAATNPNITAELTDTSYTFATTEHCVLAWRPLDNNWESEDYEVDRSHVLDNSDVTSIQYYIPKNDHFKLIDIDPDMAINNMFGCAYYGTAVGYQHGSNRLANSRPFYSNYQVLFHVKEGYEYDFGTFDGDGVNANRVTHTGWVNTGADILVPAKTYFGFCIRKSNNSNFLDDTYDWRDIVDLNSYANYSYVDKYIDDHIGTVGLNYNYKGIDLDMQYKHGYTYEASTPLAAEYRAMQGFTIYGNYIFLFTAGGGGTLRIFDKSTGALVDEHIGVNTGHGGSCAFSNTYADASDDFPLLYVSTGSYEYHQITVLRIADVNTVTVYKTYRLDADKLGYWSEQCFDFDTGLCYSFGYTKNSFTDMVDNPTKVCVIDLNSETLISGNNYSLDVIENYTIPYVYVIQSCKFKNGLCYIVSSYQSAVQASDIKVYDPAAKSFVANFPDLPLPLRGEIEDLDFVENPATSKYDMIVGVNGDPNFWKLSFM